MDAGPAQVFDDAAGRRVVGLGEELAAQDDTLVARRADIVGQMIPVGDLGARFAAQRRLAGDGEDGPQRLPAPARVHHALGGQSLPGQVKGALDGGGAGFVRTDVHQARARPQRVRSHSSPQLACGPAIGIIGNGGAMEA